MDDTNPNGRIRSKLAEELQDAMLRHIPDEQRVGLLEGAYWIGWEPSHVEDGSLPAELPVFHRKFLDAPGDYVEIRPDVSRRGVLVNSRRAGAATLGRWLDGEWELLAEGD